MPQEERSTKKQRRRTKRVDEMPRCHPNAAGIDIGAREHWVAVPADRSSTPIRSFKTMTTDLHQLADWLLECGIDTVAMESTGVYWVPLYEMLEERGIDVFLVNARHVHNVPGRKSDVRDCQWLQELHTFGLLHRSFRPTAEIVELRTYMRQRQMLIEVACDYTRRMQKALDLMNIQLHKVISDITGQTGMAIIRALVDGTYDPLKLAQHRHYACKASTKQIAEALRGNYRPEHLFVLRQALELYDAHLAQLRLCDEQIEKTVQALAALSQPPATPAPKPRKPSSKKAKQPTFEIRDPLYRLVGGVDLTQIQGVAPLTALNIIAEVGTDLSRWPTVKHFTSWLNLAPGTKISGGKRLSSRRPPVVNRVANLLRLAGLTAGRTQTALGAFHRRLAARVGKAKAVVATAHKIARIIYTLLRYGGSFQDPGAEAYEQRYRSRVISNLTRRARTLGYSLVPAAEP
jgi:transposase